MTICLINSTGGMTMFSNGYLDGYHCVSEYFKTIPNISQHICTLVCMESEPCFVLAYNHQRHICFLGQKPCAIAEPREDYVMMVLRHNVEQECLVWNQWDRSNDLPRVVRSKFAPRGVARKVQGNTIHVGTMNVPDNGFAYFVSNGINIEVIDAELLSVHTNCSLAWMPYKVGDPLPKRAVVTGSLKGREAYSIRVGSHSSETFGCYLEGDPAGYYPYHGYRESLNFDILIRVWWMIPQLNNSKQLNCCFIACNLVNCM